MPQRDILAHDCRTTPAEDRRDGGLPFRRVTDDGRPFSCDCERTVTRRDAEDLVARGRAVWKLRWVGNHRPPVVDHSEVILLRVVYPTKAHILSQRDIERYGCFRCQPAQPDHECIAAFAPRRS